MCRNLLFSVALAACSAIALAQSPIEVSKIKVFDGSEIQQKSALVKSSFVNDAKTSVKNNLQKSESLLKVAGDAAFYYRPSGTYYLGGLEPTEKGYSYPLPAIYGGYGDWTFLNASASTVGSVWTFAGESIDEWGGHVDENGNGVFPFYSVGGIQTTPVLKIGSASYQFGGKAERQFCFVAYGFDALTNAQMYNVKDNNLVPMINKGWAFGTGTGGYDVDQVMSTSLKPQSTLYVKSVRIFTITENDTPLPADKKLELTVYKVSSEGKLTDEVLGKSSITVDDFSPFKFYTDIETYEATFKFEEYDPVSGLTKEVGMTINDPYAIVISGFNQEGVNLGVIGMVNDERNGSAFFGLIEDGERANSYWLADDGEDKANGFDLMLELNGVMPCLTPVFPEFYTLTAPDAGGQATCMVEGEEYPFALLYSSFQLEEEDGTENIQVEGVPEWLKCEYAYTGEDGVYDGKIAFIFTAESLPADKEAEGRVAKITISTYGGVSSTITVRQGAANISSMKVGETKAINNNGNLELTYPAGVTSVEVMNAAGQVVGQYNLEGTSSIIPATDLAKGLYILKFNGENASTLKVMK